MKKMRFCLALLLFLLPLSLTGCDMFAEEAEEGQDVLYVYSWGDYIDAEMLKKFEEETEIHVVLDEYDTNESMYPRIAEGAEDYDVLCPSDYMVSKLIRHGLLQPLDFEQLPHAMQYIGEDFFQQVKTFDREGKYTCPIAGAPWASSTTPSWWMIPWTAGRFSGMKNTGTISSCRILPGILS